MRATAGDELLLDDVLIPADHAVDLRLPADWANERANERASRPDPEQAAWMNVLLGSL